MRSIEKLREWAQKFGPMGSHDPLMLADEIEAELAEEYMKLPKDMDGVPIRPGDELEYCSKDIIHANGENLGNVSGRCKVEYIAFNEFDEIAIQTDEDEDADAAPAFFPSYGYDSMNYHHVKPDPLKELLREMLDRNGDGVGYREFDYDFDAFVEAYADRIRELMEVDDAS